MRRMWSGVALLAVILAAGLWTGNRMEKTHTDLAEQLRACSQAAQDGQWEQADELAREAMDRWEAEWDFTAALADHTVLDEIDGVFEQMLVCLESRNPVYSAALCAKLAQMVDALQEAHRLSWRNLL